MDSNRLMYRKLNSKDFDLFYELYSNECVMKYAYLDRCCSKKDALIEFNTILAYQQDTKKGTQYIVTVKKTNKDIGIVDYEIEEINEHGGIFEIGYFIKPEFWGLGFGTEVGNTIIDYLFLNYNIHKISASCNSNNIKSENIMKKIGMQKEGVLRLKRFKNNRWEDEIKYSILKKDWLSKM